MQETLQCRRPGFDPWVGKILWRREWQSTPVFLPGECHGQRSLAGHSPWGFPGRVPEWVAFSFSTVQLSHPHMTTGKSTALTIWTFVGKVMSLLFNRLSWFVMAFLPRSKHLLISWLQSLSAVIWEPKIKSLTVSIVSPSICHEVMGLDATVLVF